MFGFLALLAAGAVQGQGLLTQAGGGQTSGGGLSVRQFEDWQTVCDSRKGPPMCRVSTIAQGDGLSVEIGADIAQDAGDAVPIFTMLTPLDLLVAKGIEMRIDGGAPNRLAYRSCHLQGCLVPFRLDDAMAGRFRRGAELDLRLFQLDGSPVNLTASLLGFIAAMEAATLAGQ